jgi:hypothetical protein
MACRRLGCQNGCQASVCKGAVFVAYECLEVIRAGAFAQEWSADRADTLELAEKRGQELMWRIVSRFNR